jgi:hypothetical protein
VDGAGLVPARVARVLAAAASTWKRILTDPVGGHVVTQAVRSYRPTQAMREFVLARANGVCAASGCGSRGRLELDHNTPYPVGATSGTNLVPLEHRHHERKTRGHWTHRLHPDTGALAQTTPLGRSYTTTPACPACGTRLCAYCRLPDCTPATLTSCCGAGRS